MPRQYVLDPLEPSNPTPIVLADLRVEWTMGGNLQDVVGFNVALTTPTGSPLNSTTIKRLIFVENPAARNYVFTAVPEGDYVGWVQTVVRGGDSKWMSTNSFAVADDGQPTVRGTDDRNVQAFCEDFRATTTPTGMTITYAATNYTAAAGALRLDPNNASFGAQLVWDVEAWIDAYLAPEVKRTGKAVIIVRMKYDAAIDSSIDFCTLQLKASDGTTYQKSFTVHRDAEWHDYRIPWDYNITLAGSNSAIVTLLTQVTSGLDGGGYVWCDALALGFDNFDLALDGNVDKGITSWNQFDSDPTGGGYFLVSPIRPTGNDGNNQLVIDENGVYWLRDESGNLVTESGYKLGRKTNTTDATSGTIVPWTDTTYLDPPIPVPEACNKVRIVVGRRGVHIWETNTFSPVRQLLLASHIDRDGFRIQHVGLEGGTVGLTKQVINGLAANVGKETITLNETDDYSSAVTNSYDGWFSAPAKGGAPFTASYYHLLQFLWIEVVMPEKKKANGSYWKVDLKFHASHGDFTITATIGGAGTGYGYTRNANHEVLDNFHAILPSDGRTHRFPIIFGTANCALTGSDTSYTTKEFSVRYRSRSSESGAPSDVWPTSVKLKQIDFDTITTTNVQLNLYGQKNLQLTYLEEF